jgi:hypothetical protein
MPRTVYYAVACHTEGGRGLEHVVALRCERASDGEVVECSLGEVVDAIERGDTQLRVRDGDAEVVAYVDRVSPPLIRTVPDGGLPEPILELPQY